MCFKASSFGCWFYTRLYYFVCFRQHTHIESDGGVEWLFGFSQPAQCIQQCSTNLKQRSPFLFALVFYTGINTSRPFSTLFNPLRKRSTNIQKCKLVEPSAARSVQARCNFVRTGSNHAKIENTLCIRFYTVRQLVQLFYMMFNVALPVSSLSDSFQKQRRREHGRCCSNFSTIFGAILCVLRI